MDNVIETILTNAGFAGALLIVCGWALWKKDRQVRDLQQAAVTREKEVAQMFAALASEYTDKLTTLADARTQDVSRMLSESNEGNDKNAQAMMSVNTTLTKLHGVMAEIRMDVRRRAHRDSSRSFYPPDDDRGGG